MTLRQKWEKWILALLMPIASFGLFGRNYCAQRLYERFAEAG
jgi:hypothetical protein